MNRGVVAGQAIIYGFWLWACNMWSRRSLTGTCNADVSLTSYGRRVRSVWLTIESIGRGRERPRRLILWLEDEATVAKPPVKLRRLMRRGLEIKHCEDFGPHKKYYPYVLESVLDRPLVTADDDMIYPPNWLSKLVAAHHEGQVTAYRARIRLDGPYATWPLCTTDQASDRVFATGVSGVAYPPEVLKALRLRGDDFTRICPNADDFWLHFAAQSAGVPVRQVDCLPSDWWPQIRLTGSGLWSANLTRGQNDAISVATAAAWADRAQGGTQLKVAPNESETGHR